MLLTKHVFILFMYYLNFASSTLPKKKAMEFLHKGWLMYILYPFSLRMTEENSSKCEIDKMFFLGQNGA